MYVANAELTIKRNPEEIIGNYGMHWIGATGNNYTVFGHKRFVDFTAHKLKAHGKMPEETPVERITSIEQAEPFRKPSKKSLSVTRLREFDLVEKINSKIPEGAELISGDATLWKETRIPTPYVYFVGLGRLLDEVQYDPQEGWLHGYSGQGTTRQEVGIITPVFSIAANVRLQ